MDTALASTRLRVLIPAAHLARDMRVVLLPFAAAQTPDVIIQEPGLCAVVVAKVGSAKLLAERPLFTSLMGHLPDIAKSVRLVADLSDDYRAMSMAHREPFLTAYEDALTIHCEIITPSQALADVIRSRTSHPVHVIEDPFESPAMQLPRAPRGDRIGICWFGNLIAARIPALEHALASIVERFPSLPLSIEVVGPPVGSQALGTMLKRLEARHRALSSRFTPWSTAATWEALDRCDIVLLPRIFEVDIASVKSHNRMVEAIRAGRIAVAAPIPAYEELSDCAWVGEDIAAGVQWALSQPDEALARIRHGQQVVAARFAPEVIAKRWAEVLRLPVPGHAVAAVGPAVAETQAPRRLNLGCGDKILAGFTNVDIAPARGGKQPDVVCDLRRLEPFATGSCDEVMAIHVVEHFWRWEVEAVLAEWVRVLRPGAMLIVECPNLLAACEALLREPKASAGAGPEGQRTMWVFYGDPQWRDPLMTHRWAYTPDSLADVMRSVGLINVRQEPAQFKLRGPRDMRIVGEKAA
jgi:glycosyltransferase involved in cell wall biosynthesis